MQRVYPTGHTDTSPRLSPGIWHDCPFLEGKMDGLRVRGDDFVLLPVEGSGYAIDQSDATADLSIVDTEKNGVVRLECDTTDNIEGFIVGPGIDLKTGQFVDVDTPLGVIDSGVGDIWFEARFKVSSIDANMCGIMIGLAEKETAGNNVYTDEDTAALTTAAQFVGFRTLTADCDGLDAVYKTASATEVVVKEVAAALAIDTWVKVGLRYVADLNKVIFYVNGVAVGDPVGPEDTDFPDNVGLQFLMNSRIHSTGTQDFDCDWWYFAQRILDTE